VPEFKPTV